MYFSQFKTNAGLICVFFTSNFELLLGFIRSNFSLPLFSPEKYIKPLIENYLFNSVTNVSLIIFSESYKKGLQKYVLNALSQLFLIVA